jgi:hypothetical protein
VPTQCRTALRGVAFLPPGTNLFRAKYEAMTPVVLKVLMLLRRREMLPGRAGNSAATNYLMALRRGS